MAPNDSQRLPTAPYDYKHTLLLASNDSQRLPTTPNDSHLLPPRELTSQPYSQEVPSLKCSVSLLVRYENAAHAYDWIVGTHGILIKFSDAKVSESKTS